MSRIAPPLFVCAAVLTASACAFAGFLSAPPPELVYSGAAPGLSEGAIVIRDAAEFAKAIEPLDPAFGGPPPDLKKRAVLRIVARPRENRCRETALLEVATEGTKAIIKLEERMPPATCPCAVDSRPPRAFLVTVTRWVKSAQIMTTEQVIPCTTVLEKHLEALVRPTLLYEGSWNEPADAKLIIDEEGYRAILAKLGLGERGPVVDFDKDRVVAITGRPRENGCRRTRIIDAKLTSPEEVVFEVEEVYPATGQQCAQLFMQPMVFLYRVPSTVMTARVIAKDVR